MNDIISSKFCQVQSTAEMEEQRLLLFYVLEIIYSQLPPGFEGFCHIYISSMN